MSRDPSKATAEAILTAAQHLFARDGYHAVSLRKITAEAGVNVAALNYHFYDKESLYRNILTEALHRINVIRLELLHEAETKAIDGLVPLDEIMTALAKPLFQPDGPDGADTRRLLGMLLIERHAFTEELLHSEFQPVMTRFGQAIRRHVPRLSPEDFLWRFSFIVGALHHSLATLQNMKTLTQGICGNDDEIALVNFTKFAVYSLRP